MMYKVARPREYLVITGGCIKAMKLTRKSWVFPWQRCTRLDLSPVKYTFHLRAMTDNKLSFDVPVAFTIGPNTDDLDSLHKYVRLMLSNRVTKLVEGVIEGETRAVAASMTMEDIFKGTKHFKQELLHTVQLQLNDFGLHIYIVNVQCHDYFAYLLNQARIDLKMKQTIQNAAKIVSTNPTSASPPPQVLIVVKPWMPQLPFAKN